MRQPLSKLVVRSSQVAVENKELVQLIKDELNVKNVTFEKIDGEMVVEYDTEITPELEAEGKARSLVRDIQEARKNAGTTLSEKIKVYLPDWPKEFEEMIKNQTLAIELVKDPQLRVEKI